MSRDYYGMLGVTKESTVDDIKKAFLEQALIWHPDKAPTDKEEEHTAIYGRLQQAYRILSNETSRRQYDNALQKTHLELRDQARNTEYESSSKYKTADGQFDQQSFFSDFDKMRSVGDQLNHAKLVETFPVKNSVVTDAEYKEALQRREAELNAIQTESIFPTGMAFNLDVFNRAFDQMRSRNPTSLEEYTGIKDSFSSTSLGEYISGLDMKYGMDFGNTEKDHLIPGFANPVAKDFNIAELDTGEKYGNDLGPISKDELDRRMKEAIDDRDRLFHLTSTDFVTEATEIEKLFPDLYAPMKLEQLEPPKN